MSPYAPQAKSAAVLAVSVQACTPSRESVAVCALPLLRNTAVAENCSALCTGNRVKVFVSEDWKNDAVEMPGSPAHDTLVKLKACQPLVPVV
jgi:hypothetical protein